MSKNSIFAAAVIAGLAFSSTGCKDDVVRKKRLKGEWTVTEYFVGGQNIIQSSGGTNVSSSFIFDKDGDFEHRFDISYSYGGTNYSYTYNFSGTWEDADNDLKLKYDPADMEEFDNEASPANYFSYAYGNFEELYDIIELSKSRLEMETTINNSLVKIVATKN